MPESLDNADNKEVSSLFKELTGRLLQREDLSADDAQAAMSLMMQGKASEIQMAGFIVALRSKGEAPSEIIGCARAMRELATAVSSRHSLLVDTCGTGGDGKGTFNISTAAAFVVAGAGVPVAKHGNRSVSSHSGSADVLEALGVKVDLGPQEVTQCLDDVGMGFLFAPRFHPSMRNAARVRKELGVRTIFNILGPLTNPARAQVQLLGVYSPELTSLIAEVLSSLGTRRSLVVHGHGGLDELSITGPTQVSEVGPDGIKTYQVHPETLGLRLGRPEDMLGGTPWENASLIRSILSGQKGPKRDVVVLNAAAALFAAGAAGSIKEGIRLAEESIDSGKAIAKLNALVETTCALAAQP
ncbi:MAG TPA: anthranilate phosphoribosyltransferase [Firmicutes bacterium]|nr:anthranilate phosphoribosyltransferase [Bacillota bacterium]